MRSRQSLPALAVVLALLVIVAYAERWQFGTIQQTTFRVNRWTGRTEVFSVKGWVRVDSDPNAVFGAP